MLPLIDVREWQLHIKMVMHPKPEDAFTGWSTKKDPVVGPDPAIMR